MIYNVDDLKEWDASAEIDGKWVSARPMRMTGLEGLKDRFKTAWQVLTGKCDGVKWHKQ
jgi:hypothetical protein